MLPSQRWNLYWMIAVAVAERRESAYGYKRTFGRLRLRSALPPKADETKGSPQSPGLTRKRHERCGGGAPRRATRRIMGHDLSTISHTLQRNSLQRDNLSKCAMFGYLQAPLYHRALNETHFGDSQKFRSLNQ